MITIKTERDRTCANFGTALAGPRLAAQRQSDKWRRDHSPTPIEQVSHQALPLDNCCTATELYASKNEAGSPLLSWFSGLVTSYRETKLLFAPARMMQLLLGDELLLVTSAAPGHACETRCVENRQLFIFTIPPPALTHRCAGTSGDRPNLPADDWTALPAAEPVAAAAMGSVVGSFVGAGASMRSESLARQEPKN